MSLHRGNRCLLLAAFVLSFLGGSTGCKEDEPEEITLQVGPEEVVRFGASSGFAHYYELPGEDDLLRIVLASYPIGCLEYEPPPKGEVFITISVRMPKPKTIAPGVFPWEGLTSQPKDGDEVPAKDGEDAEPRPTALPFVRLAEDARALPPGGELKLTTFEPETFGRVEGDLAFRDAAPGQVATTALMGDFSVRLCHLQLDPARLAPPKAE